MLRIQACITSLVLVALRSSEGFSTAQQPLSSPRSFTSKTNCRSPGSRQRRSLTTSSTSANLFSSQFRFNEHDKPSPNGRIENRHSSKDFWYNIKTLPSSTILRDVRKPVLAVLGWSTFISVVHFVLQRSSSALMQSVASSMCISSSAHSFLVSALGLLLVFRTNSAYQRFYVSLQLRSVALVHFVFWSSRASEHLNGSHCISRIHLDLCRKGAKFGNKFLVCRGIYPG